MRRIWLLAALLIGISSGPALAGFQDFTLVNRTGVSIDQLYISATDTADWEEDVLGLDVLPDGEGVKVKFSWTEGQCAWDFLVIDADGDEITWEGIDLCRASKVTLYWKKGQPIAEFE